MLGSKSRGAKLSSPRHAGWPDSSRRRSVVGVVNDHSVAFAYTGTKSSSKSGYVINGNDDETRSGAVFLSCV